MNLPIRSVLISLMLVVFTLLIMNHVPSGVSKTIDLKFDLNGETNIPAWFSGVLLFAVAVCALLIHLAGSPHRKGIESVFWLFFCMFYAFLSLDEIAGMHEALELIVLRKWVIYYAPVSLVFFLVCAYYVIVVRNDRALRNYMLCGLIVFALGGMGIEYAHFRLHPLPPFWFHVLSDLEELGEMFGTILVFTGCLIELSRRGITLGSRKIVLR